jgi:hypothetical protein
MASPLSPDLTHFHPPFAHLTLSTLTLRFFTLARHDGNLEGSDPRKEIGQYWFIQGVLKRSSIS